MSRRISTNLVVSFCALLLFVEVGFAQNPTVYPYGVPDKSRKRFSMSEAEVLKRLPEKEYKKLSNKIDSFVWFIPHPAEGAKVMPFPVTVEDEKEGMFTISYSKVVYLAPTLEQRSLDVVIAIVAHELAHIILNHELSTKTEEQYQKQEDEVFDFLCRTGFKFEAMKHRKVSKWKATMEDRLYQKAREVGARG